MNSQWNQIHQFNQSVVCSIHKLYKEPFFIEVRHYLAPWLEENFLDTNLNPRDSSCHLHICELISQMQIELKNKAAELELHDPNSYVIAQLLLAEFMISTNYPMGPVTLFTHITDCLNMERETIRDQNMQPIAQHQTIAQDVVSVWGECEKIKLSSSNISRFMEDLLSCQDFCTQFITSYQNLKRIVDQSNDGNIEWPSSRILVGLTSLESIGIFESELLELHSKIMGNISKINQKRQLLQQNISNLVTQAKEFLPKVTQVLDNWKNELELGVKNHRVSIEEIQKLFETLLQVILRAENQINDTIALENGFILPDFATIATLYQMLDPLTISCLEFQISKMLKELFEKSFVIDLQPPQLIVTTMQFSTSVKYLVGKELNLSHTTPLLVQVMLINKATLKAFEENSEGAQFSASGNVDRPIQKFSRDAESGRYYAEFKKIKMSRKILRNKEFKVADESFWLLFRSKLTYKSVDYHLSAISVPVKILSHGSQETQAWETLVWEDAIGKGNIWSEYVPWPQLAQALNKRFTAHTKHSLTDEQMRTIGLRAFQVPEPNRSGMTNYLSYAQFCKTEIPGHKFTFWQWFYEILKLTENHLCGNKLSKLGPWQNSFIAGFISYADAVKLLQERKQPGTFLLRFSESELGGISVAFVNHDLDIKSAAPFNSKDLMIRPLAERILDLPHLTMLCLHPNCKTKQETFQPYVLKEGAQMAGSKNTSRANYIRTIIRTHLLLDEESDPRLVTSPPRLSQQEEESNDSEELFELIGELCSQK